VLAAARGYKVGEKVIAHRSRQFGHSKYGFSRFAKGFLDLLTIWFLTRYGQRPQHFLGTIGLMIIALGIVNYCWNFYWHISMLTSIPANTVNKSILIQSVLASLLLPHYYMPIFIGMLFIALGFVAELFVARTIQPEKCYSVKNREPATVSPEDESS
jgi:dolichol-phosphate mannosyltransferase